MELRVCKAVNADDPIVLEFVDPEEIVVRGDAKYLQRLDLGRLGETEYFVIDVEGAAAMLDEISPGSVLVRLEAGQEFR